MTAERSYTGRLEVRRTRDGRSSAIFVKNEYCARGEVVELGIWAFGNNGAETDEQMHRALHTPTCDAYAAHFGESFDARAFGAVMELRARNQPIVITEMEVMRALKQIAPAARKLRYSLGLHAQRQEGDILTDVVFATARVADVVAFEKVLNELCDMPETLAALGWKQKTTRGPMPKGNPTDWIVGSFVEGWICCIGARVSMSERSRFMRAACALLPLCGIDLGPDPYGRVIRSAKRHIRDRIAPLARVR